jgi:hypothetical protein
MDMDPDCQSEKILRNLMLTSFNNLVQYLVLHRISGD